jgi:hypothetical protein
VALRSAEHRRLDVVDGCSTQRLRDNRRCKCEMLTRRTASYGSDEPPVLGTRSDTRGTPVVHRKPEAPEGRGRGPAAPDRVQDAGARLAARFPRGSQAAASTARPSTRARPGRGCHRCGDEGHGARRLEKQAPLRVNVAGSMRRLPGRMTDPPRSNHDNVTPWPRSRSEHVGVSRPTRYLAAGRQRRPDPEEPPGPPPTTHRP